MAKRRREPDSDGITAETAEYNTVFVDTTLDTHIAMLVSSYDTVSDFKKKLVLEHMQCFPEIGEIRIHSLKVKRRANSYYLPDVMLVWSVFHGVKRSWFLSADAFGAPACHLNLNSLELGRGDGVKRDVRNVDDDCRSLSSDVNKIQTLPTSLGDGVTENNVVLETIDGFEAEKSLEKTTGSQSNNCSQVNCMGTESRPKKKRKVRHTKDVCHDPSQKDSPNMFHASGKDTSMTEIGIVGNSMVDAVKEGPEGVILYKQQGKPTMSEAAAEVLCVRNDRSNVEDGAAPEGTSAPPTAEKSTLGRIEDTMPESIIPENLIASKLESKRGQDVSAEQVGGFSVEVSDLPPRSINAGATGDASSGGNKRKKKKFQKKDVKIQNETDVEQTRKGESTTPSIENHEWGKKEEEKDLSLDHDHEVLMPSKSKSSVHADPKEKSFSPHLSDANAMESDVSGGGKNKKKKRGMKSANTTKLEKSGTEQTDYGISGSSALLCPSTNHNPEETDKAESIVCHKGKDVQMKLLDDYTKDASEKAQDANTNGGDFVEEEKDIPSDHDHEVIMPSKSKSSVHADPKEKRFSPHLSDTNAMESDVSGGGKSKNKKKRGTKSANTAKLEKSGTEQTDYGISGSSALLCPSTNHIPEETDKGESIVCHKGKDVQMKLLDDYPKDASEKAQGANTNGGDFVILTQTKQTLEDVITEEKENQSSAGNHDDAVIGKENQTVDFNPVEKNSENTENKHKKTKKKIKAVQMKLLNGSTEDDSQIAQGGNTSEANFVISTQTSHNLEDVVTEEKEMENKNQSFASNSNVALGKENHIEKDSEKTENNNDKRPKKKIKKKKVTASGFQENLPVKDQNVGNEVLTMEGNSTNFANSQQETGHVALSQVLSRKSEDKLEEMHGAGLNTDDGARTSENEGERINFKQYFVPGQHEDQVGSSDKVKKATKSNEENKTQKKARENRLPSLTIPTELQNSLKSFENQESENKTPVRKKSGKRQGDSARNSDREEVLPNSPRRSLKVSENGVKDSRPSEMREKTHQKPNEILAAYSYPNRKKQSSDISSLERSKAVPKNSANKRLQSGLSVTNKMEVKTPKKNSLLSQTGPLFQDSSSEGSEDENGIVPLNVRTHSPSDSSSLSDYSAGESDLSQDSPRNVSNDAKGRSTGGKNTKLDLSASKDLTMDMILRSSKRFKKAKLLLDSQDDQQVEFVPESQPI